MSEPRAELRDARVLVTGASGFIGRRLCRRLIDQGARVHAVRFTTPLAIAGPREQIHEHRVDLTDEAAVDALIDDTRPDVVFNLASRVVGARDLELVRPTFQANLAAAVYLMTAVARRGCARFVQVGSLEEPDADTSGPAVPSSPYAAAKWAASGYGRMCHALYDLPVVFARVFMVYGPGQLDHRKLVPYTILSLARGETPSFSSGTRPVDWVYVDDVAHGLERLATTPGLAGKRLDLGSGTLATVQDVVETIFRLQAPDRRPSFGERQDRTMEQVRTGRVDETEALLGWRPRTALETGLRATIDWYLERHAAGSEQAG